MKKRDRWQICACILREARKPLGKTRLMYRCDLAWSTLMAYLPVLVEKGLVSVNSRLYATTEKGEEWLRIFGAMEEAMK